MTKGIGGNRKAERQSRMRMLVGKEVKVKVKQEGRERIVSLPDVLTKAWNMPYTLRESRVEVPLRYASLINTRDNYIELRLPSDPQGNRVFHAYDSASAFRQGVRA